MAETPDKPDLAALLRLALGDRPKPAAGPAKPGPNDGNFLSPGRLAATALERLTRLERERGEAPFLFEEIRPLAVAERASLVEADPRFTNWGFVEGVLAEARESDPDDRLSLLDLALSIADRLDPNLYGDSCVSDLVARCLGALGQGHLERGDLAAARTKLDEARENLAEGTGDVLEKAQIAELEAAILAREGRFPQALAAIDRSIRSFRTVHDGHFEGLALARRGAILRQAGRLDEAERALRSALAGIDPVRAVPEVLVARRALVEILGALGRHHEAAAEAARPPALPRAAPPEAR